MAKNRGLTFAARSHSKGAFIETCDIAQLYGTTLNGPLAQYGHVFHVAPLQ